MSQLPKNTKTVYTRLILYVVIAMLTTMINEFNDLSVEQINALHPVQWVVKISSVVIPGLVAWRAFIDQSASTLSK